MLIGQLLFESRVRPQPQWSLRADRLPSSSTQRITSP
jgi:hypothetical protein